MAKKMLVKSLLLLMIFEVLLVSVSEAWGRRRRRRCSSSQPSGVAWVKSWHEGFTFSCPITGYSIRYWRSVHRNCQEDRLHFFQCGYGPIRYHYGNCQWNGHYVNDFDLHVHYKCPNNGFLTGVSSVYSSHHRDRRFNFRCCRVSGFKAHTCQTTLYVNGWDQEIRYRVPSGFYLVGVISVHDNHYEDRRYRFEICKFGWSG